jgi:sialate O-acetylesterase
MVHDRRPFRIPPMSRPFFRNQILVLIAVAALSGGRCRGDVTLPSLFSDNMVLQQRMKFNVWGKAEPGESVTVEMGPDSAQTIAAKDGTWAVKLDGVKSGGPYDMTVAGKNSISIHNVAIGEVWVCSGESNMEYKVNAARNGREEMAQADLPMVRVFIVKHAAAHEPGSDCEGTWVVCNPDTVKDFSAAGYFFARELNRGLHVPFGLIQSAWGPSPIAAWMPRETLEKNPDFRAVLDRYQAAVAAYPAALKAYEGRLGDWKTASVAAEASGQPAPRMPVAPLDPGGAREPSALYNGMIAPLTRYTIRGVLWYQGESNTSDPALYGKLFPAMIGAWRTAWNEPAFPFFYAQLSGFLAPRSQPGGSRWAELREAQADALSVPKTGMVVTADTAEPHEMHPANKQEVGRRFALLAEKAVYGQGDVTASGPVFTGMQIKGGKAVLTFTHADGGLVAKGGPVKGFAMAGADGKFTWAAAQVDGNQVIVQSPGTPDPVAVRYGWADFPEGNLFNQAGLPAAPFRTDAPPGTSKKGLDPVPPGEDGVGR